MKLIQELKDYIPFNEQEKKDQELLITLLEKETDLFTRNNSLYHFTASCWIVNPTHTKVLMIYHRIFDSWSWCGGHADGNPHLKEVAIQEMKEETGITKMKDFNSIFSLEILTVEGHFKNNAYVNSHLHLNITYLFEVDEKEPLQVNILETKGVKWIDIDHLKNEVSEPWMMDHIYQKLIKKIRS